MPPETWDRAVDLLVIGAGAAGMTAALVGALEGLDTLLCEKSAMVGGTTATSAGTIWIPGSSQSRRIGVPDDADAAGRYLDSLISAAPGRDLRAAFLRAGPAAIDFLEARTEVRFATAKIHPDYRGNHPGAAHGGRALAALPFDGRRLGADFARVRPPRPEFMIIGGMMVAKSDIPFLLRPFASPRAFAHVARMVGRHAIDRLRHRRGTRLVMGNALVGRLLLSLRQCRVPIDFEASLIRIVVEDGAAIGAVVESGGRSRRIRARKGVVLATGGIGWNAALRGQLFPAAAQARSLAPQSVSGDGIGAGLAAGGTIRPHAESNGLWMPCSVLRHPDGSESVFPHIILDRAKPGLIAVNRAGRRFVNEADSYHDFVQAMLKPEAANMPAYLICDRRFIAAYGLGLIHPGTRNLGKFLAAGYLIHGSGAHDLASRTGIDGARLAATIAAHNRYAESGTDEEFGRGSSDLNRFNGDAANLPNPCMRPIDAGDLFAVELQPADLANSAGLDCDAEGRVLGQDGMPIGGLYACGNDASSIFAGMYPGPGTTIGPGMVFAWLIARHISGRAAFGGQDKPGDDCPMQGKQGPPAAKVPARFGMA